MILILDYDSDILSMLKRVVEENGYQAITANNSEAAIDILVLGAITKVMAHWRLDNDGEACGRVLKAALAAGLKHTDLCVTTNNPKFMDEAQEEHPRFRYLLKRITVLTKPYRLQQILDFAAN